MDLFTTELFTKGVLPFLLVFVMVFAVLQRAQIFGQGKKQIDSLIALSVALILISIPGPRDFIVNLVPWLAVALTVLLVFLVTYAMVGESDEKKGLKLPKWIAQVVLWLAIVFVVVMVFKISGKWDEFYTWITSSSILGNLLMIVVVIVVLWIALRNPNSTTAEYNLKSG